MNQSASQMDIRYRPFIGHGDNMIKGFRCQPFFRDHEGREFGVETVLGHRGNIENTAGRNAAVLSVAFKTLARAIGQKQSLLLIVPVNSIALASRDGATAICRAFDELQDACKSAVIVEVFNLPKRVSVDSLGDITIPMLLYVSKFLATPHPETEDYSVFANLNYVGLTHSHSNAGKTAEERKKALTKFWSETTKARLKLCVSDIDDLEAAEQARQYEALAMDGPAIGIASEQLGPVTAIEKWADVAIRRE